MWRRKSALTLLTLAWGLSGVCGKTTREQKKEAATAPPNASTPPSPAPPANPGTPGEEGVGTNSGENHTYPDVDYYEDGEEESRGSEGGGKGAVNEY